MNKSAWIAAAVLILAASGLAYQYRSKPSSDAAKPVPATPAHQPPPSLLGTGDTKKAPSLSKEERDAKAKALQARAEELEDKVKFTEAKAEESRKRLGDHIRNLSPEEKRKRVDSTMRAREPRYRELFDDWKLDAATTDETLRIVREREEKIRQASDKYLMKELDIKGVGEIVTSAKSAADKQLSTLLGPDRVMEFTLLEEQMKAESLSKSREQMERAKD